MQISTPASHGEKNEKEKEFIVKFCKNNMILALHCDTNIHQKSALCIMICSKQEGHHQKRVITCLDMFWHVAVYMQISFHFSNALDVVSLEKWPCMIFYGYNFTNFVLASFPPSPTLKKMVSPKIWILKCCKFCFANKIRIWFFLRSPWLFDPNGPQDWASWCFLDLEISWIIVNNIEFLTIQWYF